MIINSLNRSVPRLNFSTCAFILLLATEIRLLSGLRGSCALKRDRCAESLSKHAETAVRLGGIVCTWGTARQIKIWAASGSTSPLIPLLKGNHLKQKIETISHNLANAEIPGGHESETETLEHHSNMTTVFHWSFSLPFSSNRTVNHYICVYIYIYIFILI